MSKRPVVLVVMDGVGISDSEFGNAVKKAYKPTCGKTARIQKSRHMVLQLDFLLMMIWETAR